MRTIQRTVICFCFVLLHSGCIATRQSPEYLLKKYGEHLEQTRHTTLQPGFYYQGSSKHYHFVRLYHGGIGLSTLYAVRRAELEVADEFAFTKKKDKWFKMNFRKLTRSKPPLWRVDRNSPAQIPLELLTPDGSDFKKIRPDGDL